MKIAAFNVKNFGISKVKDDNVRNILIKTVSRYSVVVLLEVVDSTCKAINKFRNELNESRENKHNPYKSLYSTLLGRSTYRERFVFFYREKEVTVLNHYQYDEGVEGDVLAREPFSLHIKCLNTAVENLVLIPVHTKPGDAESELNALNDVVEAVRERWRTDDIMILGDFNADGRYLPERKKKNLVIRQPPYHWLIDDDVDTTTSKKNDHSYDRIVVYGDKMYKEVVPRSAQAFNFQAAYRLTDEETQQISDHYPVEVELKKPEKKKNKKMKR